MYTNLLPGLQTCKAALGRLRDCFDKSSVFFMKKHGCNCVCQQIKTKKSTTLQGLGKPSVDGVVVRAKDSGMLLTEDPGSIPRSCRLPNKLLLQWKGSPVDC